MAADASVAPPIATSLSVWLIAVSTSSPIDAWASRALP